MKKEFSVLLAGMLMVSVSASALDYSPTQTRAEIKRSVSAEISQGLIDGVLADPALVKGMELLSAAPDGNRVNSMLGNLSGPLMGDLSNATRDFILAHRPLFNVPADRPEVFLKLVKSNDDGDAGHFFYQMFIEGVPVRDSVIDLHVGKDRRIHLINGSFPTIRKIVNRVVLTRLDAIASAKKVFGTERTRCQPTANLVVVPERGFGRLGFHVKIAATKPLGDWNMLIDAQTGAEISRLNQMVFGNSFSGKGNVYLHSPLKGPDSVEPLLHLAVPGTLGGLYAKVENEDGPNSANAGNAHIYSPTDTHFDEVMIYYQITKIHDYLKSLGNLKMDRPMKATVHVGYMYDNAYYSPDEDAMAFGDGHDFNDLAKEDVIAYHEYSHAALNAICELDYYEESGAINEGQADYFACSFTNNPKLGEYIVAKMGKDCLRNLVNELQYPGDYTHEVHADGNIWGAALWDLRTALGARISDQLIAKSFFYLQPGSPTFSDGLSAIITADRNVNNGQNKAAILRVFKQRGITLAPLESRVLTGIDFQRMQLFRDLHGKQGF